MPSTADLGYHPATPEAIALDEARYHPDVVERTCFDCATAGTIAHADTSPILPDPCETCGSTGNTRPRRRIATCRMYDRGANGNRCTRLATTTRNSTWADDIPVCDIHDIAGGFVHPG